MNLEDRMKDLDKKLSKKLANTEQSLKKPWPSLFFQERFGKDMSTFKIIKLRTCEVQSNGKHSLSRTPVGKLLSKLSMDELYFEELPDLRLRYDVLPGMTGLAQVRGMSGPIFSSKEMERRLNLDLFYIKKKSIRLDLRILCATILLGFLQDTSHKHP